MAIPFQDYFYCEDCRVNKHHSPWPEMTARSYGPCDFCGTETNCYTANTNNFEVLAMPSKPRGVFSVKVENSDPPSHMRIDWS